MEIILINIMIQETLAYKIVKIVIKHLLNYQMIVQINAKIFIGIYKINNLYVFKHKLAILLLIINY